MRHDGHEIARGGEMLRGKDRERGGLENRTEHHNPIDAGS